MKSRLILAGITCLLAGVVAPAAGGTGAGRARPREVACGGASFSSFSFTGGERIVRTVDIPVCARGDVTVTFTGARPACAVHGLCDDAGTETTSVQGAGELTLVTARRGRRLVTSTQLFLTSGPTTAAVTRSVTNTSCHDTDENIDGGGDLPFGPFRPLRSQTTLRLSDAAISVVGTRCAGPLVGDVRAALPSRTLALSALARGGRVIDLGGARAFHGGGFTGTVASTVVLTLGRPQRQRVAGGAHLVRTRVLTERDTVVGLAGRLTATVATSRRVAACGPLDACGLTGTITLGPRPAHAGALRLTATAPARRPVAAQRAALNLTGAPAPRHVLVIGGAILPVGGPVRAALAQPGGGCRDATAIRQLALVATAGPSGRLVIAVDTLTTGANDPLRTRCPGPQVGEHLLAAGSVSRATWRRRTFTVDLHGGRIDDGPYRVTIRSTLRLVLRRGAVTSQIIREPSGDA